MIVIAGALIGGIWGGRLAAKRGGERLDIAQYAAGFGIVGLLLGLILTVAVDRLV